MQIPYVADVKEIEIPVGERDTFSGAAPLLGARAQLGTIQNLVCGFAIFLQRRSCNLSVGSGGRWRLSQSLQEFLLRDGGRATFHDYDSARIVSKLRGFFSAGSGG